MRIVQEFDSVLSNASLTLVVWKADNNGKNQGKVSN